jgi:outer membrane lipoprotein-sorting protein
MIGHSLPSLEELPYIPTMRINRLDSTSALVRILGPASLALASAFGGFEVRAQGPGAPGPAAPGGGPSPGSLPAKKAEEPPTEAERFIDLAIKKIAQIKSVSADVRQEVKMLNQDFKIQGRYLRAPGTKFRMDLKVVDLPDTQAKMLQVCDGEILWEFQQYFDTKLCSKKNVKQILEKLNSPELNAEMREAATLQLGLAGPEALLMGLRKSIKFNHMEEGSLDGKPVVILEGNWRDRTGLLGPNKQQVPMLGMLPPYIPSLARLYLGKEDSWPYRVNLTGKPLTVVVNAPAEKGPDGKPRAKPVADSVAPTSIVLIYANVSFDSPANPDEFKFDPPREIQTEDMTEAILGRLDQAIKVGGAMQKAEAAKSEIPVLNESIPVPNPAGEPAPR